VKFYPKTKKALLLRQFVGDATDEESGEKTELAVSMADWCPIITLASGDAVIIEWEDLIKIAQDHADAQNAQATPRPEGTE
jgi:hypothetical protein